MARRSPLVVLFVLSSIASSAASASECFPECRRGYVCSPEGTCVSACNPPCGESEVCDAEERTCRAKEPIGTRVTEREVRYDEPPVSDTPYVFAEVAAVYQAATHEEDDGSVGQGGFGLSASIEFLPGIADLFLRPRVLLVFAEDEVQPEISLDVGYRFLWKTERALLGIRTALVPAVWIDPLPDDRFGLYLGGQAAPFAQFGKFHVSLPIEVGVQTIFDQDVVYITAGIGIGYGL